MGRITIFFFFVGLLFCRKVGDFLSNCETNYFDFKKIHAVAPPPRHPVLPGLLILWYIYSDCGWLAKSYFAIGIHKISTLSMCFRLTSLKKKLLRISTLPLCNYFSFTTKASPAHYSFFFCVYLLSLVFSLWCLFLLRILKGHSSFV